MKKLTTILFIFILLTALVNAEWEDLETTEQTIGDFNFEDWQAQKETEGSSEDLVGRAFEIKQQFLESNKYEKSAYLLIIFFLLAVISYLLYLIHIKESYEKRLKKVSKKLKRK